MSNILFERVIDLCKEKGISQRKLQEDMGMSTGALSKWRTSIPNGTLLQKVADYFNVTPDYLMGRTKYRNKDHMLQSFDLNFKPDMNEGDPPKDMCIQTDEGIVLIESMSAAPTYIEPETRELAEKIMEDDKLKHIFEIIESLPKNKFDGLYNMLTAMNDE